MDAGADDYITKPFDQNELQVRLRAGTRLVDLQAQLLKAREDAARTGHPGFAHAALEPQLHPGGAGARGVPFGARSVARWAW